MSRIEANGQAERVIHDPPERIAGPAAPDPEAARPTMKAEAAEDRPDEAVGQTLGRYKLLQKIGEGGCGAVYMAEQEQPVRRRVALKVIKLGMDTRSVIARFEAERQALAMMDHPNIAKVLDAGATETGRPYFVMELVRGIKFTDYCDQNHFPTRQRLELFIQICQAIQHAHQKGIIHRDIKPSNILVTLHDGVPVPKVIDFGIAKATTDQRLTDKTLFTAYEQFIGTPAYMSPEQAEMSGLDIDTRTDIYSLGVLLYELLTGRTPFDPKELAASGLDAMRKTIREKEPLRPSTRLQTLAGEELTTTAKCHGADVPRLVSQLRGDLDWIVMKCLEKDRSRRYETASGLAMDLKRHLNSEPVLARPPSKIYEFQKTFRRHKVGFAATAAIILVLAIGITLATWQALRAKRAEALALQTRGDAEELSNFILEDFYTEIEPTGRFETIARLAEKALAYYDRLPPSLRTPDTERNRAMAQARLALVAAQQDRAQTALPLATAAVATFEEMRKRGDQSEAVLFGLGLALFAQFKCYLTQIDIRSEDIALRRGIEVLKPLATSPDGSPRTKLAYADFLNYLSGHQPGEQGIAMCEEALRVLAGLGALECSDLSAASEWADIADSEAREALNLGRVDEAERLEKQMLTVAQGVLARRPSDLRARLDLSFAPDVLTVIEAGRFHDAAALQFSEKARQAAQDYVRFNPSDPHGWLVLGRANYSHAAMLFRQGRVTEGLQEARAATATDLDPKNSRIDMLGVADLQSAIARWEAQRGQRDGAEQSLQNANRSFEIYASRTRLQELPRALLSERFEDNLRQVRLALGEDAVVCTLAKTALARLEKFRGSLADQPSMMRVSIAVHGRALAEAAQAALHLRRYPDAEAAARALLMLRPGDLQRQTALLLDQPDDLAWGRVLLAQALAAQGRTEEALKTLEPALAHYRDAQTQGATHLAFRQHFARALYVQALAEPAGSDGKARRRDELDQADRLLQALPEEARQLHDSKELFAWIQAEQKKPDLAAQHP